MTRNESHDHPAQKPDGGFIQHTTGAPDVVISKCTAYLEGGQILPLTEEKRKFFIAENKRLAGKVLRVLAAGYREWDTQPDVLPRMKITLYFWVLLV